MQLLVANPNAAVRLGFDLEAFEGPETVRLHAKNHTNQTVQGTVFLSSRRIIKK